MTGATEATLVGEAELSGSFNMIATMFRFMGREHREALPHGSSLYTFPGKGGDPGFVRVLDEHTIDLRCAFALQQQRHDENPVRRPPVKHFLRGGRTDQRMQDCFEAQTSVGVGEDPFAQSRTIERSIGTGERGSERAQHRRVSGRAWRSQRMGEPVGIGDVDAAQRERVGDGRLAAPNPTGQSDDERHGVTDRAL